MKKSILIPNNLTFEGPPIHFLIPNQKKMKQIHEETDILRKLLSVKIDDPLKIMHGWLELRNRSFEYPFWEKMMPIRAENSETLNHVLKMYKNSLANPCNNDVILNFEGFKRCKSNVKGKYGFSNQINKFVEQIAQIFIQFEQTVGILSESCFVEEALLGKFSLMYFPICYDKEKMSRTKSKKREYIDTEEYIRFDDFHRVYQYLTTFIFSTLDPTIVELYDQEKNKLIKNGLHLNNLNENFLAVHIRKREIENFDLNHYLDAIEKIDLFQEKNIPLYIFSDDFSIYQKIRKLRKYDFYTSFEENPAPWSKETRMKKYALIQFLIPFLIALESKEIICTFTSNVCRLMWRLRNCIGKNPEQPLVNIDGNMIRYNDRWEGA